MTRKVEEGDSQPNIANLSFLIQKCIKLSRENYKQWRKEIAWSLAKLNLLKFVTQGKVSDEADNWEHQDCAASVLIAGTLPEEFLDLTDDCMSVKELWETIEKYFGEPLRQKKLKKQTLELEDYYVKEESMKVRIVPTIEKLDFFISELRNKILEEQISEESNDAFLQANNELKMGVDSSEHWPPYPHELELANPPD